MKHIFFIRHAKSSWDSMFQQDFDRPLNNRGIKDSPVMADYLRSKGIVPDLIISSSANRAKSTAILFCDVWQIDPVDIVLYDELYHASPTILNKVIRSLDDNYNAVFLFAHNPGLTEWINRYSDAEIDNLPTCGIANIEFGGSTWSEFAGSPLKCSGIWYPKMLS